MEKPKYPVLLSPEAVVALRQILYGSDGAARSPSAREISQAIDGSGCSSDDRAAVLLVLGLADESLHVSKRHVTLPG
jgi:hypothetical protein